MALLATRALDDLSLREIARAVGVSATAVYRHFPDKKALMVAMAGRGVAELASAQRAAAAAAGGGAAGFTAAGRAYVRFALANPALFRLIFSNPDVGGDGGNAPSAPLNEVGEALAQLRADAASLVRPCVDPAALALQAWSVAHGLSMLMLDGRVPAAEATIDAVLDSILALPPREQC